MNIAKLAAQMLADLTLPHQRWAHPVLIGLFGVPGAGKTAVADHLASHYPLLILSTDALRLRYGLGSGPLTRQVMDQLALQLLPQQISIVFDGIHLGRRDRMAVHQLAQTAGATAQLVYVTAAPEVIKQRLQARMLAPDTVAAEGKFVITPEHFQRIVHYLEPLTPDEYVIGVDTTSKSLGTQLDQLDAQLTSYLHGEAAAE